MDPVLKQRFLDLRRELFTVIERTLMKRSTAGGFNGYTIDEGVFQLVTYYPGYFECPDSFPVYVFILDTLIVGPTKHYEWHGKTLEVAFNKAEHDIRKWINEDYSGEFFYE